jgi:hypothetical protein
MRRKEGVFIKIDKEALKENTLRMSFNGKVSECYINDSDAMDLYNRLVEPHKLNETKNVEDDRRKKMANILGNPWLYREAANPTVELPTEDPF